ncbi:TetR family transcriptional regulator [Bacillus sp. M6-12]|uniref:TetR/AcrR family transcriptional regulator n=1 Tax=Bacillus sp. M6-12 TaxID=2054166 RepID=UPI000C77D49D|nr:TetR/AcrR family transcriptional regulator [Bacillus sp. M6-12]PLS14680.1 TetR family transcriptional regulator [Bacillus sp. M6-12]
MIRKEGDITDLKERIIETSLSLFEKKGFHGVTVNDIVRESGTSKGGFYHHFHSKDELLYVIHDYFISYVLTKAQEANATSQNPTEKLQKIIKSFVKVFDLYKPHLTVFYQESTYLNPQYEEAIKAKRDSYKNVLFQVLREGMESGEFRNELPVEITGMSILGMVNWTQKWYRKEGKYTIEEIADIYVDLVLQSLLTEEKKRSKTSRAYFLSDRESAVKSKSKSKSNDFYPGQTNQSV